MDSNALNWRGVVVFGLAVLTVIVLIAVIDDEPAPLGINTAQDGTDTTTTTVPGASTTTVPGASTTTTKPGTTATTKPTTATTAFNPAGKPTIQAGSTDTASVTLLQQQLQRLGYLTTAPDGAFGAGTTAAVIKFQNDKKITPADGVVGPATWAALSTS